MVLYPDDNMEDPAKPRNSAMAWKSDTEWSNKDHIIDLFPNTTADRAKYVNEDSKTSMEDGNTNDENCMYKDDRDNNFNMESSNSSESCQSGKDFSIKQESEPAINIVTSTSTTNSVANTAPVTQCTRQTNARQKGKSKESAR